MRGLTFQGNGAVAVADVPEPTLLAPTDAIVQITMAGICGSDLHILHAGEAFGFAPGRAPGSRIPRDLDRGRRRGAWVRTRRSGDGAVGVSCGHCVWCQEGLRASCEQMSIFGWAPRLWRHGGAVEGGQSEFARVPLADTTVDPDSGRRAGPRARDPGAAAHRRDVDRDARAGGRTPAPRRRRRGHR